MELALIAIKRQRDEERESNLTFRIRLDREQDEFNKERIENLVHFQREKEEFARAREEWLADKKRMFQQLAEEKRVFDTQHAQLQAKLASIDDIQEDLGYAKAREEGQLQIFKSIMDKEMQDIKAKRAELDRQAVAMKLERLKFEFVKSRLDAEVSIFGNEREEIEKFVGESKKMHLDSVKERIAAQMLRSEGTTLAESLETMKADVVYQTSLLDEKKKSYLETRLLEAKDRGETLTRATEPVMKENRQQVTPGRTTTTSASSILRSPLKSVDQNKSPKKNQSVGFKINPSPIQDGVTSYRQYSELDRKLGKYLLDLGKDEVELESQLKYLNQVRQGTLLVDESIYITCLQDDISTQDSTISDFVR